MTDHTQQYQLAAEEEQRRLDELTKRDHGSVADLTHEIGMCRFLVERNSSNPSLCNALLSTCAKLCASHQLAMERAGTTLPRETILRICMGVVKLVAEEFCDLPESQERLDRAINRIDAVFAELVQPPPEPLRITDQSGTLRQSGGATMT
jgi:hypothetical protein